MANISYNELHELYLKGFIDGTRPRVVPVITEVINLLNGQVDFK